MTEYPPEVQAVLDAAVAWQEMDVNDEERLSKAVAAYRKAIAPPEPCEMWAGFYDDALPPVMSHTPNTLTKASQVWRCTVTPIERVR